MALSKQCSVCLNGSAMLISCSAIDVSLGKIISGVL